MASHAVDYFYKEALRLKYVARSAFKLIEIQKKHNVIKSGGSVLDLGCAPGAWLQVACQSLGSYDKGGVVIGVDVKKIKVPGDHTDFRVKAVAGDVMKLKPDTLAALSPARGYNTIISDMCPLISGIGSKDAALSAELGSRALELALGFHPEYDRDKRETVEGLLIPSGNLVVKLLEGEESQEFPNYCKKYFRSVSWFRTKASRSTSREIYLIAKDRNRCKW